MSSSAETWAVLGAGSWGTVLAIHLTRAGHPALLWTHLAEQYEAMRESGANEAYVPDARFPAGLTPAHDLPRVIEQADNILIVVPSKAFREVVQRIRGLIEPRHRVVWGTKGFEPGTRKLLHEVVREELGEAVPVAVATGPTFAREVARALPCAIVVASPDLRFARWVARSLKTDYLVTFTSRDITGAEIGGATKNVVAIGAGIADGMGFGANARAALITRGLNEIMHLGRALGGKRNTFMGLSGLGDLVLTCSDDQSRNRRFGLALGSGMDAEAARRSIGQVVEGMITAETVHLLADEHDVAMPICRQVYQVIYQGRAPREAVNQLMSYASYPELA